MAFVPGSIANQVTQPKAKTGGFVPGSIATKTVAPRATSTFTPGSISGTFGSKGDTKSSNGLYQLAIKNGLQPQADRILKAQQGEQTNRIYSGGFIMDTIDTLNALQYGVAGVLKGKSFMEGVQTRSSFSDKDSLGANGIPGIIAGIALDIAVDPLTYIAPYTVLKKIPMLSRIGKAAKEAVFGKVVTKGIVDSTGAASKTYQAVEGGTVAGRLLVEKLAYKMGKDPVYMGIYERGTKNMAITTQRIAEFGKPISQLTPEVASAILKTDKTGRFVRESLANLGKKLTPDQLAPVAKLYNYIDNLGKEAVELGLLSKAKYEENMGEYIKNAYMEYEQKTGPKLPFGFSKTKISPIKSRKDVENIDEFGLTQVKNPAYLLMKSAIDLTREVENAKMFKQVAEKFGTDVAQEGFTQMPKTTKFVTSQGAQAGIKSSIADINSKIKPLLNELKITFKADKKALSELLGIESFLKQLGISRGDELYKFFNEGEVVSKVSKIAQKIRGWAKLPEALQPIGKALTKFKTLQEALKSPVGIKLEQAYENGVLERAGFKNMEEFFSFVTEPYKAGKTIAKEEKLAGDMSKIIKLQKQIEKLTEKSNKISEIDKTSINNSFINLEKNLSDLRFAKEDLQQGLADAKLGDLAGKYVPNHIFESLNELITPETDTIGKALIANFKFAKVVMNPATHVRNIISNSILNYWKLGMNPLDPRVIRAQGQAVKEIAKGSGKWIDEATPLGYNLDTFASAEFKNILESPEMNSAMGKAGSAWQKTKKTLGDLYQGEENFAKLTSYIFQRDVKKLSPEDAWKAAESATFNYAQVTPLIRKIRTSIWGMPFITFSYKATPLALETALKHPDRISVIGKIKKAIEAQSDLEQTDRERASEPPWMRDGFYIKLPGTDAQGRSKYFDLTYILPFGDLMSGQLFERGLATETGTPEGPGQAILRKNPVTQLIMELGKNRNFYGNKIWKESDPVDKQARDMFIHITKTYSPPLLGEQLPNGYNAKTGETDWKGIPGGIGATEENQQRNLVEELARNAGIKIQPLNAEVQETFQEWNKKKALETLLKESGVMKGMEINYIPK